MKRMIPAGALALLLGSGAAFAQQPNVDHVRSVRDLASVCDIPEGNGSGLRERGDPPIVSTRSH